MGEGLRGLVELALEGKPFDEDAREIARAWLVSALPDDVQLLLVHAVGRARRGVRRSPSGTLQAVREQLEPAELEVLRRQVAELQAERDGLKKQLRGLLRERSDGR